MPRPRPGARATAHRTADADPSRWGRVDDDGTVWLRTADGERAIGQWRAGSPDEALAHYAARYRDVSTEIDLLESRLRTHPDDSAHVAEQARHIRDGLGDTAVIGDVDALARRLDAVVEHSREAGETAKRARAGRREEAIARKEALAAEAEDLAANSTEWKAAGDRIRAILDEWRTIRGIDRATDDALWKRYSRARDSFNRRRGSHFAELDRGRAAAKREKETLIEEAEALKGSTDWGPTAAAYRDLMRRWKAAGRAPRDVDDRLWKRFKAAQDEFFGARNAVTAERDREYAANAEAKEALLAEYDSRVDPSAGLDAARAALRELQGKWEEIGYVPRGRVREFEDRIGALERRVSDAADAEWRRTDPEARARVAQFEERAATFEKEAAGHEAAGRTARAEEARATAAQWREWAEAARRAVDER